MLRYNSAMEHTNELRPEPWRHALDALRAGENPVLVMVIDHSGSVPGVTGTFVVVSEKGIAGTIGGGAAEKQLIDTARGFSGEPTLIRFRHTPGEGGTLCAGEQVFAVISLTRNDGREIQKIVDTLRVHRTGTLTLSDTGLRFNDTATHVRTFVENGDVWSFTEPLGLLDTLYIIGGGHVSLALSRIMATLPYRIVVLDNRKDLPTMAANRWAHERHVVEFEDIARHVPEGDRSWAVIMTFGHEHDGLVLEGLLGRDLAYLGLMGSKSKVRKMFRDLEISGVPPATLETVRAPLGLPIGSHTPEEIAISIAAEIVAVRNGKDS
jgi:xanthine dehydrogenase accessory factor